MKLTVFSYKVCWYSEELQTYVTFGGFPFQIQAISQLFEQTNLVILERQTPMPSGTIGFEGENITFRLLPEPSGQNLRRKINLLAWAPKNLRKIWKKVKQSEAVHILLPGDIGLFGLIFSLIQKKPLFIRHCGTWNEAQTVTDRFTFWLLEKIAGGRNVVLATGGGVERPSQRNKNIHWIFSTSITIDEYSALKQANPWKRGEILELVVVSRLSANKNVMAIVDAIPEIVRQGIDVKLSIVGDGPDRRRLERMVQSLGIGDRVTFCGNVKHKQVLEILSESHIFVFPTRVKEGFPKAVVEAMACGLPIVASTVSVLPYLIKKGQCGLLLDDTSPESVADAVLKMTVNPQIMQRMGGNARVVARQYTLEKWRDQIHRELTAAWGEGLRVPRSSQDKING